MENRINKRVIDSAEYMIENKATIQATADKFGVSQSTTHSDVRYRLGKINPDLKKQVDKIIESNILQGKVRGGISTSSKYRGGYVAKETKRTEIDTEDKRESIEVSLESTEAIKQGNSFKAIGTSFLTLSATLLLLSRKNKRKRRRFI